MSMLSSTYNVQPIDTFSNGVMCIDRIYPYIHPNCNVPGVFDPRCAGTDAVGHAGGGAGTGTPARPDNDSSVTTRGVK